MSMSPAVVETAAAVAGAIGARCDLRRGRMRSVRFWEAACGWLRVGGKGQIAFTALPSRARASDAGAALVGNRGRTRHWCRRCLPVLPWEGPGVVVDRLRGGERRDCFVRLRNRRVSAHLHQNGCADAIAGVGGGAQEATRRLSGPRRLAGVVCIGARRTQAAHRAPHRLHWKGYRRNSAHSGALRAARICPAWRQRVVWGFPGVFRGWTSPCRLCGIGCGAAGCLASSAVRLIRASARGIDLPGAPCAVPIAGTDAPPQGTLTSERVSPRSASSREIRRQHILVPRTEVDRPDVLVFRPPPSLQGARAARAIINSICLDQQGGPPIGSCPGGSCRHRRPYGPRLSPPLHRHRIAPPTLPHGRRRASPRLCHFGAAEQSASSLPRPALATWKTLRTCPDLA